MASYFIIEFIAEGWDEEAPDLNAIKNALAVVEQEFEIVYVDESRLVAVSSAIPEWKAVVDEIEGLTAIVTSEYPIAEIDEASYGSAIVSENLSFVATIDEDVFGSAIIDESNPVAVVTEVPAYRTEVG